MNRKRKIAERVFKFRLNGKNIDVTITENEVTAFGIVKVFSSEEKAMTYIQGIKDTILELGGEVGGYFGTKEVRA